MGPSPCQAATKAQAALPSHHEVVEVTSSRQRSAPAPAPPPTPARSLTSAASVRSRPGAPCASPSSCVANCRRASRRRTPEDRKSTRLNYSHYLISYAVVSFKKKKKKKKNK